MSSARLYGTELLHPCADVALKVDVDMGEGEQHAGFDNDLAGYNGASGEDLVGVGVLRGELDDDGCAHKGRQLCRLLEGADHRIAMSHGLGTAVHI